MKVILQQDIPKVGRGGDIVTVADGYARNYLFPRKYAVPASGGALKELQARAAREKERTAGLLQGAQREADKLEGKTLTILSKVGTGTKLYGSVTSQDVADAVKKETGITVDKRRVGLADPIKMLGEYSVPVRLHSDVSVNLKVVVTTEEELARKKVLEEAAAAKAAAEAAAAPQKEAAAEPVAAAPAEEPEAEAPAEVAGDAADEGAAEEAPTSGEEMVAEPVEAEEVEEPESEEAKD